MRKRDWPLFNIGDEVMVVVKGDADESHVGWCDIMDRAVGKVGVVRDVLNNSWGYSYQVFHEEAGYWTYEEEWLAFPEYEEINLEVEAVVSMF